MTQIASHRQRYPDLATAERTLRARIDASAAPADRQAFMHRALDDVLKSGLWSYMLMHGGLNGYWTDYIVHKRYLQTQDHIDVKYYELPVPLATQQRNRIFMGLLQGMIRDGIRIASIPCGMMRDVLALDFSGRRDFALDGYDLDEESIDLARQLSAEYGLADHARFFVADAWTVGVENEAQYDVCVSNGLNIYVPEAERTVDLYRSFRRCLKPGGRLIASCLTYPPSQAVATEWDLAAVDPESLALAAMLFGLFEPQWSSFRSIEETTAQLREAGFSRVSVHPDAARIMPTFLAVR